jgi:aromatic-L-amino-acid/L-tryptophan decarboxylase
VSFADDGRRAVEWAAAYRDRVGDLPVLAQVAPGEVSAALPRAAPEQGRSFEELLAELDRVIVPGVTHWQSPRFFAYFSTTGSNPGILAELLTGALNNVGILWRASPALQELETTVLAWLAQLIGLPQGWHGHLEEGASFSTLASLAAAREAKPGARVVVCSEHAHSSVDKACRVLELEVRKTPADEAFRLRPELLDLTDACAVVATVGTTSSTSVDPVAPIADACERAGVWLHIDAAYAGSAMICPELRSAFDGIERVDSVVVNPHKWLFTPQGCSALWTKRPEAFRDAFGLVPEYLRTPDEVVSFSEYSAELGRPFRALKLWAVLTTYGAEGLRARIREAIRLAELFETWVVDTPGWELCAPRPFSVVCFRREGTDDDNEALMQRVNATGEIFVSHTKLDGRHVLRLAIGNERTTEADVLRACHVLEREAAA